MDKIYTRQEIIDGVAAYASNYNIKKVYLFGSYARGEATPESDLDFLIELGEGAQLFDQYCFIDDMEDHFGVHVDVVAIDTLKEDAFKTNIWKEKASVYQKDYPIFVDYHRKFREASRKMRERLDLKNEGH